MPSIFLYLVKVSLSLGVVYLFYLLVLRKLTFYNWNRWYLLGYSVLSFFIALVNIAPFLQRNELVSQKVVQWVPTFPSSIIFEGNPGIAETEKAELNTWKLFAILLLAGMTIMLCRFFMQLYSVNRIKNRAKLLSNAGVRMFDVDEKIIPFSFGNAIFFNRKLHSQEELEEIIRHEFVHVKQKHTMDILWGEILCLLNWYNPFAWLIKASIRQNLEFIADHKVVQHGLDKKQYQYLLLKVVGNKQFSIAQKFNFVSLKKRIAMMNKLKTARVHAFRFLFLIPLISVLLLAFRQGEAQKAAIAPIPKPPDPPNQLQFSKTEPIDTVAPVKKLNSKGYYIDIVGKGSDCVVVIKDKERKEVKLILLTEWDEKEDYYTGQYGEILPPPPPPPPPAKVVVVPKSIAKDIDINDGIAVMTMADGTIEKYDLNNKEQLAVFEKKFGKVIPLDSITTVGGVPDVPAVSVITTLNGKATSIVSPAKLAITTVEPGPIVSLVSPTKAVSVITTSPVTTVLSPVPTRSSIVSVGARPVIVDVKATSIVISKYSSRADLEEFKKKLKDKGVEMDYTEIKYNEKGVLIQLKGNLKSKKTKTSNGSGNVEGSTESFFSASDFSQIVIVITMEDGQTRFSLHVKSEKQVI